MGSTDFGDVREFVLATWPDGGRLSRVPENEGDDDTSDPDIVLGYWRGDEFVTGIDLYGIRSPEDSSGTGQVEMKWDPGGRDIGARVCWFLVETLSVSWFRTRDIDNGMLLDLPYVPQFLDEEVIEVLADDRVEELAREMSEEMVGRIVRESEPVEYDRAESTDEEKEQARTFLARLEEMGLGRFQDYGDEEVDGALIFEVRGNKYHLEYRPTVRWADKAKRKGRGRHSVHAFSICSEAGDFELVGSGNTPAEALRDVPFFVWPGTFEEWRKRLDPGTLTFGDLDVYSLLGELAPCWWETRRFERWARDSELPIGLQPHRLGRWR